MFNKNIIKIGLTGNRFSGKNHVADMFRKFSIPIFEADVVLRFILNYDYDINKDIRDKLSSMYGTSPSFIDITKFKSKEDIDMILDVAEYNLFKAYEEFNKKNSRSLYTIFKSSILFERNWNDMMDYNINVFSPKLVRMDRWEDINMKDIKDITYILSDEIPGVDKNKLSNFVVNAYGDKDVSKAVNEIDKKIIDDFFILNQTIKFQDIEPF
jgi:dephospho-CoA kinase